MSSLTIVEKRQFERLFQMADGYILGFSNRTFAEFVADSTGRDPNYEACWIWLDLWLPLTQRP